MNNNVLMGTLPQSWKADSNIKYITFSVTDDCNLRCTYCYFTHKSCKNVMSFETAKKAVDEILTNTLYDYIEGVVWDFIGGEPTLEIDLIDQISDYILFKMYKMNHKWLHCYRFMIGTNGLLYNSEKVQKYITKHHKNLSVAITIDGSKEKHDMSRIKVDGTGSYDDVRRIIPLWQKQFGGTSTKATFSHDDLPYLKDSIINLWNMGITNVSANVVFEDCWEEGDPDIFKDQLYQLADYIIENNLWYTHSVRFFDPNIGTPYTETFLRTNFCGSGKMMAINTNGEYYPCVRFMPSATNIHKYPKLGSITESVNPDRLRAFYALNTKNQSNEKCLSCDIAGGCAWCSGFNYDVSRTGTLYERQTFICEMHKANVEVNKYLWRKYELIKHLISPYRMKKLTTVSEYNKYLYIICDNKCDSFCDYSVDSLMNHEKMDKNTLEKAIQFCEKNNYVPVFCGCNALPDDYYGYQMITYAHYKLNKSINKNYIPQMLISVDEIDLEFNVSGVQNFIIKYYASQLQDLYNSVKILTSKIKNVNINISLIDMDCSTEDYINEYNLFLSKMNLLLLKMWSSNNYCMFGNITNELFANSVRSCGAGHNTYTLSPDGRFYICPGFYYDDPCSNAIGSLDTGINNIYSSYCDMENAPLCKDCIARHCKRCVYKNKIGVGEYHIPTELQCVLSRLEYKYSRKLVESLRKEEMELPFEYNMKLLDIDCFDPIEMIRGEEYPNHGYSKLIKDI